MREQWYRRFLVIFVAVDAILVALQLRTRQQTNSQVPIPSPIDQSSPPQATTVVATAPSATSFPPARIPLGDANRTGAARESLARPSSIDTTLSSIAQRLHGSIAMRLIVLILLLLALTFAIRGQQQFADKPEETWDEGIAYYLAAIAAFSLSVFCADRFLRKPDEPTREAPISFAGSVPPANISFSRRYWREAIKRVLRPHPWRALIIAIAFVLAFILLGQLRSDQPLADYTLPLVLWLASIGLYAAAVIIPQRSPQRDWRAWWKANRQLTLLIVAIFAFALFVRVYNIGNIPPTVGGDEGSQGVEALKFLNGELRNPFVTSWLSVPTFSFFFNSLTIKWLGHTAVGLRLPWAIIGAATILIMFWLVRRLKGTSMALMTAALLAAYHYHIHFSRLGSNQVADAFFMAAAFLFLYRANDEGHPFDWVLAGIVAGLAQYWYAGARFVTIMVGVAVIWFIMRGGKRFLQAQWKGIVMLIGAFLISAGPMLQHAIRFPDDYNARLNAVGVFESGWLQLAEKTWKQGAVPILFGYQLKRAALSYNAYPDRTSWYGSPQPFFDFPMGVLFMLGLSYATLRPFNRKHFPMLIWWWGAIILGGMLTESPPSSQRLVTTGPPAVFFVALSLEQIGSIVRRVWQSITLNRLLPAFGAAAIIALSALSINWYFNEYTPMLVYGNDTAVIATGIAHYADDHLGPDWRMYFFGPPRMYINFGSIAYLVPDIEGRDIPDPLTAPPPIDFAPNDKNAAFIFLPERRAELDLVRQTYPNGVGEAIPSPRSNDPNPLFIIYRVVRR